MDKQSMKNMVVLKDLPSNIIDEAIVILKPNVKFKSLDKIEKSKKDKKIKADNSKKYIINEAEMIISNYLSKIENEKNKNIKINSQIEMKYKRLKALCIGLGIMFLLTFFIK